MEANVIPVALHVSARSPELYSQPTRNKGNQCSREDNTPRQHACIIARRPGTKHRHPPLDHEASNRYHSNNRETSKCWQTFEGQWLCWTMALLDNDRTNTQDVACNSASSQLSDIK